MPPLHRELGAAEPAGVAGGANATGRVSGAALPDSAVRTSGFILKTSDIVAIAAAIISVIGALVAGAKATGASQKLATERTREEKRNFCLHLQQQFDSPEFFRCRYQAWQKLDRGDFGGPIRLSALLRGEHWTSEVSTTLHFFESLNRYCDQKLIDEELAAKLFGRSYEMWWQGLIAKIEVDEEGERYRGWLDGIRALHDRIVPPSARTATPIGMAAPRANLAASVAE